MTLIEANLLFIVLNLLVFDNLVKYNERILGSVGKNFTLLSSQNFLKSLKSDE